MSNQSTMYYNDDITGCKRCKHFTQTDIFILCTHEQSKYRISGKEDYHTCAHMRQDYSPCGNVMKLRSLS